MRLKDLRKKVFWKYQELLQQDDIKSIPNNRKDYLEGSK